MTLLTHSVFIHPNTYRYCRQSVHFTFEVRTLTISTKDPQFVPVQLKAKPSKVAEVGLHSAKTKTSRWMETAGDVPESHPEKFTISRVEQVAAEQAAANDIALFESWGPVQQTFCWPTFDALAPVLAECQIENVKIMARELAPVLAHASN